MTPDTINGSFELIGGVCSWLNVYKYLKSRKVVGIFWPTAIFYVVWGIWNLFYYPALGQPFSFVGGIFLTSATLTWLVMVIYDSCKYHLRQPI
jgi:hypothetical protein